MPLVDKVKGYDIVYKWFDYLKGQGYFINAFVPIAIGMPNHVHAVISFIETEQNINSIIGNGKRFMAYDIVKRLKENNEGELLNLLANAVERKRKANSKNMKYGNCLLIGKIAAVKNLYNRKWITFLPVRSGGHSNLCKGKWNLGMIPEQYQHRSAKFYLTGPKVFFV